MSARCAEKKKTDTQTGPMLDLPIGHAIIAVKRHGLCDGCYFFEHTLACEHVACNEAVRKDGLNVIYKEVTINALNTKYRKIVTKALEDVDIKQLVTKALKGGVKWTE